MNKYTVTIQLDDKDQFQNFVDNIGPLVGTVVIKVVAGQAEEETAHQMHVRKAVDTAIAKRTRAPRVSKVNTAIVNALQTGNKDIKGLKQALEDARLSPGSLSTGLAQLQKAGQVERTGSGLYGLRSIGYSAAA